MRAAPSRRTAVLLLASGLALAGCGGESDSIADQAKQGDDKGYIAGDGTIQKVATADRRDPVELAGKTLDGTAWDVKNARGKVVVLNVWGAWCGPCQKEMPELQKAWSRFQQDKKPVQMMGLDQRDSVPVARSTLQKFKVTYPSLQDDGGQSLLGLQGSVVTTPTTLVLDRQGRIAARVSGETTASTVRGLVDDVLAEKP